MSDYPPVPDDNYRAISMFLGDLCSGAVLRSGQFEWRTAVGDPDEEREELARGSRAGIK